MCLEPKKVEAWLSENGNVYLNYNDALEVNKKLLICENRKQIFKSNEIKIKEYILNESKKGSYYNEIESIDNIIIDYDNNGWDCENSENPLGKCIYEWDINYEDCLFCGEPEERK